MRDLQQLKDDYAQERGFDEWGLLTMYSSNEAEHWDNIIELAQKEALKNAHEVFLNNDVGDTLEQELILSESNILR